ncbi:MAG: archease [Candidatus Latescibacteria bacterium]|nr:archease [Candidatus Latescibacterota bacterium]
MSEARYRVIDHTADIGIAVENPSLEGLFEDAAFGMFDLVADLSRVEPRTAVQVDLEADSVEDLFVDWLRELLFRFETELIVFRDFRVQIRAPHALSAEATGEVRDPHRHELYREFKAVTYHDLRVEKAGDLWRAQVIFDV